MEEKIKLINALRTKCQLNTFGFTCDDCPRDYYCHTATINIESVAADVIEDQFAQIKKLKEEIELLKAAKSYD